ncbi:hypothetical protein T484DRAFT_1837629 [Baffinella frigidus]|nr:hypothetical protein T484DRAFT_1837629 [Cryptophyta sp. CCMP2293]
MGKRERAFSIYAKIREPGTAAKTRPGAYANPDTTIYLNKAPAYSIGGRIDLRGAPMTPGPGAYEPIVHN